MPTAFYIAVEDDLSDAVVRRLLNHVRRDFQVRARYPLAALPHLRPELSGFGHLRANVQAFNHAAAQTPHLLLTDLDVAACAPELIREWLNGASASAARMTCRFPIFLDAANVVAQRKGEAFMSEFGAATTGVKPKTTFLRPSMALPLGIEVVRQLVKRTLRRAHASEEEAYAARAVERSDRATAFRNGCLIDPDVVRAS
jgi:hypothetical protein